jgi:hypothetical protein
MECVAKRGETYGLALNFTKVESMPVNCEHIFVDPHGNPIQSKTKLKYLGAHIAADGSIDSELGQKLGIAACDFKKLQQVWSHSKLSRQFKFQIYIACIVQKLLYGLEGAWVNTAGKRKLDGFHARCLRKIGGISPAFISRVSNAFVLKQFSAHPLSKILLERQLMYFGHVARSDHDSVLRQSLFKEGFVLYAPKLKRGRPRDTWDRKILQEALIMTGSIEKLKTQLSSTVVSACGQIRTTWKDAVRHHCRKGLIINY